MEQTFADAVTGWRDFYTLLGGAAATLLGLLFVAVSLRLDLFRNALLADVRDFAFQTFASLFCLVLVSLIFLIPHDHPGQLGVPLIVIGVLGLGWNVYVVKESIEINKGIYALRWPQWIYLSVPFAIYATVIVIAALLWQGKTEPLFWLVLVDIAQLTMASLSSWFLLSNAGPPTS